MLWLKAFFKIWSICSVLNQLPFQKITFSRCRQACGRTVSSARRWLASSMAFLFLSLPVAGCSVGLAAQGWTHSLEKNFEEKFARSRDTCRTCVGGCNTVEMNGKAPSNIQNLFKDVSSQMKFIVKTLDWQDAQKKSIVEHKVIIAIEGFNLKLMV